MLRMLSVVVALAVLTVGCGDDETGGPNTTTSTTTSAPTSTSSTTSTSTSTSTTTSTTTTAPPPTSEPETLVVQVFFLEEEAFNIGRLPYVRPVERTVDSADAEAAALDELFAGPTDEEREAGLVFVASEATGVDDFSITGRIARVHLAGGCSSGGSTFTVANQILPTLLQFTSVDAVKIYDPEGTTGSPDTPGDSIPFCLEP